MKGWFAYGPALVLVMACGSGNGHLPDSAGGQGEVLVVMGKGHWEGEPGAAVRSILEQPLEGLPRREPRFRVAQTTPENFGSLLAVHHSVLLADIGAAADTTGVVRQRDRHARGQYLVRVAAKDPAQWIGLFQQEGYKAADELEAHQRDRLRKRLSGERDAALAGTLKEKYQIELDIPAGYRVVAHGEDATWLQRDRVVSGGGMDHNVIEGVLVHIHPYTSEASFTVPFLVEQRDSVTKALVDGPNDGSYMIVQRSFEDMDLMPTSRTVTLDGRFAFLMRGLYGMHGAKMGGPFVSLSTVDEARGRLITVEGFAYAPHFDKRDYVRELEAILFSLRIVPQPSS